METQGANPFRIRACRNGAHTVRTIDESIADLAQEGGEDALQDLPNIGEELARWIVEALDVSTLEGLQQAAHDGRLGMVEGFGSERVSNIRVGLAGILSTAAQRGSRRVADKDAPKEQPGAAMLLDVD